MKNLNNYITEKLHLRKGVKHCHGELKHFIVVYSSRGEDKFKFFNNHDDAVIFSKKEYYLAGWCLTQEQYEETWDVVCHMTDEPFNTIREDWLKRLVKYAEENNLVGLFKYEKITEKLHLRQGVERNNLLGKYSVGDICMLVTYVPAKTSSRTKEPSFVTVDAVEIMKDTGMSFILKYLTNTGHTCKENRCSFKYTYQTENNMFPKDNKFIESYFGNGKTDLSFRSFLVSPDSCKDIYDYIDNNDRKLCYHLAVKGNYNKPGGWWNKQGSNEVYYENIVCTPYYDKPSLTWKNVCGIDKTNLDKIKKALGL